MRTFPVLTDRGVTIAFEVENATVAPRTIGAVFQSVPGVTSIVVRRPFSADSNWHLKFDFHGRAYLVVEPFGDNSRFWIGPENTKDALDIEPLQAALKRYRPPVWRRLLGVLVAPGTLFDKPDSSRTK